MLKMTCLLAVPCVSSTFELNARVDVKKESFDHKILVRVIIIVRKMQYSLRKSFPNTGYPNAAQDNFIIKGKHS